MLRFRSRRYLVRLPPGLPEQRDAAAVPDAVGQGKGWVVAPAAGWRRPYGGRAVVHVAPGVEYQETTTQACGLYPPGGSGSASQPDHPHSPFRLRGASRDGGNLLDSQFPGTLRR